MDKKETTKAIEDILKFRNNELFNIQNSNPEVKGLLDKLFIEIDKDYGSGKLDQSKLEIKEIKAFVNPLPENKLLVSSFSPAIIELIKIKAYIYSKKINSKTEIYDVIEINSEIENPFFWKCIVDRTINDLPFNLSLVLLNQIFNGEEIHIIEKGVIDQKIIRNIYLNQNETFTIFFQNNSGNVSFPKSDFYKLINGLNIEQLDFSYEIPAMKEVSKVVFDKLHSYKFKTWDELDKEGLTQYVKKFNSTLNGFVEKTWKGVEDKFVHNYLDDNYVQGITTLMNGTPGVWLNSKEIDGFVSIEYLKLSGKFVENLIEESEEKTSPEKSEEKNKNKNASKKVGNLDFRQLEFKDKNLAALLDFRYFQQKSQSIPQSEYGTPINQYFSGVDSNEGVGFWSKVLDGTINQLPISTSTVSNLDITELYDIIGSKWLSIGVGRYKIREFKIDQNLNYVLTIGSTLEKKTFTLNQITELINGKEVKINSETFKILDFEDISEYGMNISKQEPKTKKAKVTPLVFGDIFDFKLRKLIELRFKEVYKVSTEPIQGYELKRLLEQPILLKEGSEFWKAVADRKITKLPISDNDVEFKDLVEIIKSSKSLEYNSNKYTFSKGSKYRSVNEMYKFEYTNNTTNKILKIVISKKNIVAAINNGKVKINEKELLTFSQFEDINNVMENISQTKNENKMQEKKQEPTQQVPLTIPVDKKPTERKTKVQNAPNKVIVTLTFPDELMDQFKAIMAKNTTATEKAGDMFLAVNDIKNKSLIDSVSGKDIKKVMAELFNCDETRVYDKIWNAEKKGMITGVKDWWKSLKTK